MKPFSRRNLYLLLMILLLGALTSVIHAAAFDVDTFDADAQVSTFGAPCSAATGGTDMLGGERNILVTRTSGSGTIQADVDTSVANSLAFSIGASTRGTALIQLDGADGVCTLSFGLSESLSPYDGLTLYVSQVDLNAIVRMWVYTTATDYSEFSYVLPYAISAPGTEIYFPFDQFTNVGAGANYGSVGAIEVLLDGTTIDSLDMTLDYISSDYSRDYGDLPAAYNNTEEINNGARHRIGAYYFGSAIDSEPDGQESGDATGDAARINDEAGVGATGGGTWGDGSARIFIDHTRPTGTSVACVVGWIDWDGDNVFESTATVGSASELVVNNFVSSDGYVTFTSPTTAEYGGTYPATLNARFRIFRPNEPLFASLGLALDPFGCPSTFSASTPAQVTQLVFGEATDGEVEDYQWAFSPTAITLSNATANGRESGLALIAALIAPVLIVTGLYIRRRRFELNK